MKKLILFTGVVLLTIRSDAQFSKATLQASGLTCAMCSNAINKALQALPFIESVKSDIKNSSFNIIFRQTPEVSIDVLKAAVEDAGFSVAKLKLTGKFENVRIGNDEPVVIGSNTYHFLGIDNQILNGEKTITVVDKDFLTSKEFKKYSGAIKTGETKGSTRVYHVTI